MANINGTGQADILNGTTEADIIRSKGGNDTVLGADGNDKIYGGNGNDVLLASVGNDTLNGGDGTDTVVFSDNRADYTVQYVNANVVIDTDAEGNAARVVRVESFEFADVTQTFAEVHQPYVSPDDLFLGIAGAETFDGGAGDETLMGDNIDDYFVGGDGIDTFDFSDNTTGMQVVDLGFSGALNLVVDTYDGNILTATDGATGVEQVIGTDQADVFMIVEGEVTYIDAGAGDDIVLGSLADDTPLGGSGNDQIGGLEVDDFIATGDGVHFIFVDRDTSTGVTTGGGHDVVTDFDITMDVLIVQFDAYNESYDPFSDLTQTTDGALLDYAPDASILLEGVDISDLTLANLWAVPDETVNFTGG